MRYVKGRLSTTHVDLQGDRMSVEALRSMARQITEKYLPTTIEHDIRIPPVGRLVSAEVVPLDDGEFGLDGVTEYWEPEDTIDELRGDGRIIPLRVADHSKFGVVYDRSFFDSDGQRFVVELAALAGPDSKPERYEKKALDPISTLLIVAGVFAVGGIVTGFFNKLGGDLYHALKQCLKYFYEIQPERDRLIDFQLTAVHEKRRFEVHVILENPSPDNIEDLFQEHFKGLESIVGSVLNLEPNVAKVVAEWKEDRMILLYAVRTDGVPTLIGGETRAP